MEKIVYTARKVSSKGQVTIPRNLIDDLSKHASDGDLSVKFTGEYNKGKLNRIIIESEDNHESGYSLEKRIEDWKAENGYSESEAQNLIKESMNDYETYPSAGKEL